MAEQYMDEIGNAITSVLRQYGDDASYSIENNGRAIEVESLGGTRFWMRLLRYNDKLTVNMSTVCLNEHIRRKGVFTKICEALKGIDSIDKLVISSVCTEQMFNFCVSRGLTENSVHDYWIIKES